MSQVRSESKKNWTRERSDKKTCFPGIAHGGFPAFVSFSLSAQTCGIPCRKRGGEGRSPISRGHETERREGEETHLALFPFSSPSRESEVTPAKTQKLDVWHLRRGRRRESNPAKKAFASPPSQYCKREDRGSTYPRDFLVRLFFFVSASASGLCGRATTSETSSYFPPPPTFSLFASRRAGRQAQRGICQGGKIPREREFIPAAAVKAPLR